MVVAPLRNSLQSALITLIAASLACCALSLSTMPSASLFNKLYQQHILYNYLDFRLHATWTIQTFNMLVILLGAALVNLLAIHQEIVAKNNYIPAFLYLLLAFSSAGNDLVHPALVANIFVLLSLYFFMDTYRVDHALSALFKAGFFMGIAPFFYVSDLLLFPLCFIMLSILRPFHWRDWGITLIGFLLPLYLFMSISYLMNKDIWRLFEVFGDAMASFRRPLLSEYGYPFLLMLVLLLLLTLVSYLGRGFGVKIKTQKTKYILLWLLALFIINVFLPDGNGFIFISCTIPFSILMGDYLGDMKQLKIANTLLFLLLGGFAVIYLHRLAII